MTIILYFLCVYIMFMVESIQRKTEPEEVKNLESLLLPIKQIYIIIVEFLLTSQRATSTFRRLHF